MSDRDILINEIKNGPLSQEIDQCLSSLDYLEIVSILNRKDVQVNKEIDTSLIRQYLLLRDLLIPLKISTSLICKSAIEALYTFSSFNVANPLIYNKLVQLLDALVADTEFPDFLETDKTYILSLGTINISRAEQIIGREVRFIEIMEILWNPDGSLNQEVFS